jgi:TctA family transporter
VFFKGFDLSKLYNNILLSINMEVAGMVIGTFLIMVLFFLAIAAIAILALVFWILMLVDSIKRKYKDDNDKIVWVLVIVLLGILGAIVYYFVIKRDKKK